MSKITQQQFDEIRFSLSASETAKLLEKYTDIEVTPCTVYQYFDSAGDFVGDSENYTIAEVLEKAGVEVIDDEA